MTTWTLFRDRIGPVDTTGQLRDENGHLICLILEDRVRIGGKVRGETAIPPGKYEVRITHSPRFQRNLPILLEVPGFSGIRIHTGNDREDTEGCLLPGTRRQELSDKSQYVYNSRSAFSVVLSKIEGALAAGGRLFIEIT